MPDIVLGQFSVDIFPPELLNPSPASGALEQFVTVPIQFDLTDPGGSGIDRDSIWVSVDGEDVLINGVAQGGWQVGFVGISHGYHINIIHPEHLPGLSNIEVQVQCSDLATVPNIMSIYSWNFYTQSEYGPPHSIKYNIYYKAAHRPDWILSNSEPLNHNIFGNQWVIRQLEEGVTYHVAIVAGIIVNGEWVPLSDQSLVRKDRGVGDLNIIKNHPYYVVKTFSPE